MFKGSAFWQGAIIIMLLLFIPSAWASDFTVISTSALKTKIDAKEDFMLVNSLSDIEFGLEHIPGSINIPVGETELSDKLPDNKTKLIVFY